VSWVSLLIIVLKFAYALLNKVHDEELINEGEDRQITKMLMEMTKRSKVAKEIDDRFAHATPEEVEKALDKDFRD
jgi:hypothetical protein